MKITPELIRLTSPAMPRGREHLIAPTLAAAAQEFGITTRPRVLAFLAQLAHESVGFRYVEEIWGPTIAQKRYEGRRDLGNIQRGDGYRFRGRGWIQITGRANYVRYRPAVMARFGVDIVKNPDAAARPEIAAFLAAKFWFDHGLNELADTDQFTLITRRINGGINGLADRKARWFRLLEATRSFKEAV